MLFTFGKFWKTLVFVASASMSYSIIGFELTTIILLSLIYSVNFKSDNVIF